MKKSLPNGDGSRRKFLRTVTAGAAGASIAPTLSSRANAISAQSYNRIIGANERVGMGLVGVGRMGRGHLNRMLTDMKEAVDVVALCDVYEKNLRFASQKAPDAAVYADFRELIDHPDVDALMVSTPDHWHALPTVYGCQAGKDVYVEKPSSLSIPEGRRMVQVQQETGSVVQVGTQQRSSTVFKEAVHRIRSGVLGPVTFVRSWNYGNEYPAGFGYPPNEDPPPGLDWDMWLGPAPMVPFNASRFGALQDEEYQYERWATFRYFWNYAGGMMTDWGVHLLDIVLWAMNEAYPDSVNASGAKFVLEDNRDTPDTLSVTYQFPGFVCTYENRTTNRFPREAESYGITFHGPKGTLFVNRGYMEVIPEEGSDLQPERIEADGTGSKEHFQNFLDCIKSREAPICDMETGHRSSSIAILGNLAYRSKGAVHWDGASERIIDNAEANRLYRMRYRHPWKL